MRPSNRDGEPGRALALALALALAGATLPFLASCTALFASNLEGTSSGTESDGGGADAKDFGRDSDGAAEAGPRADAGAARPCTTPHTFCDDFDNGLASFWGTRIDGTATLQVTSDLSFTSPKAVRSANTRTGLANGAMLVVSRSAPTRTIRCSFRVFLSRFDGSATDSAEIFTLAGLSGSNQVYNPLLRRSPNRTELAVAGRSEGIPRNLEIDRWTQIDIAFVLGAQSRVRLAFDGESIVDDAVTATPAFDRISVFFGVGFATGSSLTWDASIDDAYCDLE